MLFVFYLLLRMPYRMHNSESCSVLCKCSVEILKGVVRRGAMSVQNSAGGIFCCCD